MQQRLRSTVARLLWLAAVVCVAALHPLANAEVPDAGYVVGPEDQIVIRAMDVPEFSDKPILVGTNGNITLPLIGRVKVGGLTVEQIETELNNRYGKYVRNPQVSVSVTEVKSHPVSVFGAVTKPGVVQLQGRKTLYEVLSMAGGPRDTAGGTLTITRRRENGDIPLPSATTDPTNQLSVAEVNLQEILDGKNPTGNIEIKANDVISVSESSARMIYVVGDVQHAGAFSLGGRQNLSVLKALSMAGGLGRTAKPGKALILRSLPGQSKCQEIPVDITRIFSGKNEDLDLRSEDVLVVPSSSRKAFALAFVPTTLSTAISAAMYRY